MLEIPERVPFRLTQNIISAMGMCGWKGEFFESCKNMLSIVKGSKEFLHAHLEALVNDPVSDHVKNRRVFSK